MTSTATTSLRLEKQGVGDNPNDWGNRVNVDFDLLDEAIAGFAQIVVNSAVTLTTANYATDQARKAVLRLTGAGGFAITIPAVPKWYFIDCQTTADCTIKTPSGTPQTVLKGTKRIVYCDGTEAVTDNIVLNNAASTAFTPYGNIAATNVQTALQELDDEKLAKSGGIMTGPLTTYGGGPGNTGGQIYMGNAGTANITYTVAGGFAFSAGVSSSGGVSATTAMVIRGAAGVERGLYLQTNASIRAAWIINTGAESGGNAGSDVFLNVYNDAGAYITSPIAVTRATGNVEIGKLTRATRQIYGSQPFYSTQVGGAVLTSSQQPIIDLTITATGNTILGSANGRISNAGAACDVTWQLVIFDQSNASAIVLTTTSTVTSFSGLGGTAVACLPFCLVNATVGSQYLIRLQAARVGGSGSPVAYDYTVAGSNF